MNPEDLDARIAAMLRYPFRAKFHLRAAERRYLAERGMDTIHDHALDFIDKRLAPATPPKDGRQTPWGGHPVFRAQHATGTCCRGCLERNHGIRKGHELSTEEREYVAAVICRWIELDYRHRLPAPAQGSISSESISSESISSGPLSSGSGGGQSRPDRPPAGQPRLPFR